MIDSGTICINWGTCKIMKTCVCIMQLDKLHISIVVQTKPASIVFENAFHKRMLLAMTLTNKVKPY